MSSFLLCVPDITNGRLCKSNEYGRVEWCLLEQWTSWVDCVEDGGILNNDTAEPDKEFAELVEGKVVCEGTKFFPSVM